MAASFSLASVACEGDGRSPAPPTEGDDGGTPTQEHFVTQPGWPNAVRRTLLPATHYRAAVDKIVPDAARARTYVGARTWSTPDALAAFALTAYDALGSEVWSVADVPGLGERLRVPGAAIGDFVVHPSGALSILELRPAVAATSQLYDGVVLSTMHLWRLDLAGNVVSEVAFTPESGEDRRVCKKAEGTFRCERDTDTRENLATYAMSNWGGAPANRLLAVGDELVAYVRIMGAHLLYRLDASFQPRARRLVFPRSSESWWYTPLVGRDGQGRIAVTVGADQPMLDVLAASGGPSLTMPTPESTGVLLFYYEGDELAPLDVKTLAVGDVAFAEALVGDGDQMVAVLNLQFERGVEPNNVRERDVAVVRLTPGDEPPQTHVFDVADDDAASGMVLADDGTLWIGGSTNFVQVDTNSVVKEPEGLILAIDRQGAIVETLRLVGPRGVTVTALARDEAGGLFVGGSLDSPITHTCDDDPERKACTIKGFFGRVQRP